MVRNLVRTKQFDEFYSRLSKNVQTKVDYALSVLLEIKVVSTKLVKKLVGTDFYELRISVGNEYRVILFAIDNESFIEAKHVLLLNGFLKKSTKDYGKEINKAQTIIKEMEL